MSDLLSTAPITEPLKLEGSNKSFHQAAYRRAKDYADTIIRITENKSYLNDFAKWLEKYQTNAKFVVSELPEFDRLSLEKTSLLEKLHFRKKLGQCIDSSMFYILLRDVGLDPRSKQMLDAHQTICRSMHRGLLTEFSKPRGVLDNALNFSGFLPSRYWQDKEVQQQVLWLKIKIARIKQVMPQEFDADEGIRKLIKVIGGVLLHSYIASSSNNKELQKQELIDAIQLGYSYGVTYPLIDDLLDNSKVLNAQEKASVENSIRLALNTQSAPIMPSFSSKNRIMAQFVYDELSWSLNKIKDLHGAKSNLFFRQAELFYLAQEADSQTNDIKLSERLALMILKSSGSRLVVDQLLQSKETLNDKFFYFGILNQFNDDIKDILIDLESGHSTPYTESVKNGLKTAIHTHIAIVYYLIKHVYQEDEKVKELLIARFVNAVRSANEIYTSTDLREQFTRCLVTGNISLDKLLAYQIKNVSKPVWLDKIISYELSESIQKQADKKQLFKQRFDNYRNFIDQNIALSPHNRVTNGSLHKVANHTLLSGGKRVRSVFALHLLQQNGQLSNTSKLAILQLLEYMHTASLIIDDLPSQDNSGLRRGVQTAHVQFNSVAMAELGAISLMMKAVEVQAKIKDVPSDRVLASLQYAANTTQAICEGQYLDLSMSKQITVEQLEEMSWLKTGLALEASFVIPAMILGYDEVEISRIKSFCRKLGLLFQIKDDLLDYEGDPKIIGKPVEQDREKVSFVSLLGKDGATERLAKELAETIDSAKKLSITDDFLMNAINYIAIR